MIYNLSILIYKSVNFYQLWSKMSDNKKDIIINHLRVRFSKKFILPLSMYDFV